MENKIKAYIVDDESPARDELRYLIQENCPSVEVIGESDNASSTLDFLKSNSCDLLFLDIEMPEQSGVELVNALKENSDESPYIIFVTAYNQFALKAFELNAVDYLLKPVAPNRLQQAIEKVEERMEKEFDSHELETSKIRNLLEIMHEKQKGCQRIALYLGDKLIPIDCSQLIYATVEDKITFVFTAKGKFSFNGTLNELERMLPANDFFRSHKSYLVNLTLIESIEIWFNGSYQVSLRGSDQLVPVSRNQAREFKDRLNIK